MGRGESLLVGRGYSRENLGERSRPFPFNEQITKRAQDKMQALLENQYELEAFFQKHRSSIAEGKYPVIETLLETSLTRVMRGVVEDAAGGRILSQTDQEDIERATQKFMPQFRENLLNNPSHSPSDPFTSKSPYPSNTEMIAHYLLNSEISEYIRERMLSWKSSGELAQEKELVSAWARGEGNSHVLERVDAAIKREAQQVSLRVYEELGAGSSLSPFAVIVKNPRMGQATLLHLSEGEDQLIHKRFGRMTNTLKTLCRTGQSASVRHAHVGDWSSADGVEFKRCERCEAASGELPLWRDDPTRAHYAFSEEGAREIDLSIKHEVDRIRQSVLQDGDPQKALDEVKHSSQVRDAIIEDWLTAEQDPLAGLIDYTLEHQDVQVTQAMSDEERRVMFSDLLEHPGRSQDEKSEAVRTVRRVYNQITN